MPVDLSSLLADTLSARGYEVEDASPLEGASGASYPVSLVARRDGRDLLVDVLASRTVRDEDVQAVASIVDDAGLDGAIVIALAGAENSDSAPGADRVDVWDSDETEAAVGAHVLDLYRSGEADPDDIGPSPVEPYDVAAGTDEPDRHREPEPEPMSAPDRNGETPTDPEPTRPQADPDPTPEAGAARADPSQPTTDPGRDRARAKDPQPTPEPAQEPDPQASTAEATEDEDPAPEPAEEVDHRDLVDPEDMLERAERLMEQGAVDDGDAELIVEDEEPAPAETGRQDRPDAQPGTQAPELTEDAAAEASPERTPREEPADDGSDAEILEPEPSTSRPEPDAEPPEPDTAATARPTEADTDPDPESSTPSPSDDARGTAGSVDSPAAAAGPADRDPSFVSGTTIEPQIDRGQAIRKAEEALFEADDARLELLPFRVYRYQARLVGDGTEREEEGRVWVSTQSGAVVRAPTGDRVEEIDAPHERFEGSLAADDTQRAAREHLLDTLERRDERRQDYSESAVIERVHLEPDADTLVVDRLGKAYAPRWRVDGRNGTVFVDAVTGELVTE